MEKTRNKNKRKRIAEFILYLAQLEQKRRDKYTPKKFLIKRDKDLERNFRIAYLIK